MLKERHVVIVEGKTEDLKVTIVRRGKKIVIDTERPGVAKSVLRAVVDKLTNGESPIIGFKP